jgi:hypothetical protein
MVQNFTIGLFVDRRDIPNAFACDRTSKAADYDSSSSNWFMRRSSVRTVS